MTPHPTILARIQELGPLVRQHAPALDRDRRLPDPLFEAMADAGLFRLWLPEALGGAQLGVPEFLEIVERVSGLDGSVGWNLSVGGAYSRLGGYFPAAVAERVFASPRACLAGTINPTGQALPVPGGFRVTGRWSYGSGIHQASTVLGNCLVAQPAGGEGPPIIRTCLFEKADVTIIDNWQVGGLRGTGSCDFEVKELFVPDERTIDAFAPRPTQPGTLYRMPVITVFASIIAAVPLGIARAAIDEAIDLCGKKTPTGGTSLLRDRELVQADLGRAEACLGAAGAFLRETLAELWSVVDAGGEAPMKMRARVRLACAHAAQSATQAVDLAAQVAGATANFTSSPLERAVRDVHAAIKHIAVVPNNYVVAGRVLLGLPPGTPRF